MTNAELSDWVVNIFDADIKGAEAVDSDYVDCVKTQDLRDALSVIRELKAEIERLRQEKADAIERIKRMAEEIPYTPAKTETDGIYLSGKYWGMRDALDIINKPKKEGEDG